MLNDPARIAPPKNAKRRTRKKTRGEHLVRRNRRVSDDPKAPRPASKAVSTCLVPLLFASYSAVPRMAPNESPEAPSLTDIPRGLHLCGSVLVSCLRVRSISRLRCVSPNVPHSSSRAGRAMLCPSAVELRKQDGAPRTSAWGIFKLKDPRNRMVNIYAGS